MSNSKLLVRLTFPRGEPRDFWYDSTIKKVQYYEPCAREELLIQLYEMHHRGVDGGLVATFSLTEAKIVFYGVGEDSPRRKPWWILEHGDTEDSAYARTVAWNVRDILMKLNGWKHFSRQEFELCLRMKEERTVKSGYVAPPTPTPTNKKRKMSKHEVPEDDGDFEMVVAPADSWELVVE